MNLLKFRRLPKVGIMLAVLAGCASPTVQLYTIAVEPGPTVIGSPKTIALHDISLAGYLDRSGIVRSADDAIVSKTQDGIITSWNRGATKIFGYTETEVIGRPATMLFPPRYRARKARNCPSGPG